MGWIVIDPRHATVAGVKVARVGVPYFPDEIEYETIMGRAFDGPEFDEWRKETGIVILATDEGYQKLEQLIGSQFADVPELTIREETKKLCLERQAVVLKWVPVQ